MWRPSGPLDRHAAGALRVSAPETPPARGNAARFRLTALISYDYTRALTGYRLDAVDVGSPPSLARIPLSAKRSGGGGLDLGSALTPSTRPGIAAIPLAGTGGK